MFCGGCEAILKTLNNSFINKTPPKPADVVNLNHLPACDYQALLTTQFLSTIPRDMAEEVIDLISGLVSNNQCELLELAASAFQDKDFYCTSIVTELVSRGFLSSGVLMSGESFKNHLPSFVKNIVDFDSIDNDILRSLLNLITISSTYKTQSVSMYIIFLELLPSKLLLAVLSNTTSILSQSSQLTSTIVEHPIFWSKVFESLNSIDCSIRKRSLFLLTYLFANKDKVPVPLSEDVLVVLEVLEETQSHIIRPILAKIPRINQNVCDGLLDPKWLSVIFRRVLSQESRMVSRWGLQLLLDLPHTAFQTPHTMGLLEDLVFSFLNNTYMFYRPTFVEKGSNPPLLDQLLPYITSLLSNTDNPISQHFLDKTLDFLSNPKTSSTPLTMVSYSLSSVELSYTIDTSYLRKMCTIFRSVLPTQPHKVKGAVQGFLLRFVSLNCSLETVEDLRVFGGVLQLVFTDYVLDSRHNLWNNLAKLLVSVEDTVFEEFVTSYVEAFKDSTDHGVEGFGLVVAMADQAGLMTDKITDTILNPLRNCGMNLYIPPTLIVSLSATLDNIYRYFGGDHKDSVLLATCQNEAVSLFESLSMFYRLFPELVHLNPSLSNHPNKDGLSRIALLLSNIHKSLKGGHQFAELVESLTGHEDTELMLTQLSALLKTFTKPALTGIIFNVDLDKLVPYLSSNNLSQLESSWTTFSILFIQNKQHNTDLAEVLVAAVDSVQKIMDPSVILEVLELIHHLTPGLILADPKCFITHVPNLIAMLKDFSNTSTYWNLLSCFCNIIFDPVVMDSPDCVDTVIEIVGQFKDLTSSKEMVMSHVIRSLCRYPTCKMGLCSSYLDLFLELSLFGVTTSREKQNSDDLLAFIEHFGEDIPVNCVYKTRMDSVPLGRIRIINLIYSLLEGVPVLHQHVLSFYFTKFRSIEKAALQNSVPNRLRIRVAQSLLCLLPAVLPHVDGEVILRQLVECLAQDSQPSVRCFIELCVGVVLMEQPGLVSTVLDMMRSAADIKNSNAFLTGIFSILYHHILYLQHVGQLEEELWRRCIGVFSIWTCANNHNVRSFACLCLSRVADIGGTWVLESHFRAQTDFIVNSFDYKKLLQNFSERNVFFSEFKLSSDLCLANIFYHLPQQMNILENECVRMNELAKFSSSMFFVPLSGTFHEIPRPKSLEQKDYLLRFQDLSSSASVQKKISPWQVMATNLGVDFDRGSTVKGDLVVFASMIDKHNNLGGLSRTGEIFGVKTMVINNREVLASKDFKSLSMTSEKWLNFEEVHNDIDAMVDYFKSMKREGYTIVGVEQALDSVTLQNFRFPSKSVLVLGRERDGVPVQLLSHLDVCVEIPQLGLIRSLNVHVSASLMIWEYSKQHLFCEAASGG